MIVGLTGGIASGKTTVATMIKNLDIPVVDADQVAREVVEIDQPAYKEIVQLFGKDIINDDRTLNRKKLGAIVFHDEAKLQLLNLIVHPAVRISMLSQVEQWKQKGYQTIVLDIPLLFESNLTFMVEKIMLVFVNEEIQLKRLIERDQFSKEDALARIEAQMPISEKIKLADEVINNEGSLEETNNQLLAILKKWKCI